MRVLHDGGIDLLGSSAGVHTGRSRWAFALAGVRARRSLRAFAMMIDGDMRILRDAGMDSDQGGFGAAECASQRLTVLREAAGFDMISLQGAGRGQGGWSGADGPSHQLAVLVRKL